MEGMDKRINVHVILLFHIEYMNMGPPQWREEGDHFGALAPRPKSEIFGKPLYPLHKTAIF